MRHLFLTVFAISVALTLGACSQAKEQLGLNKETPDEFAVVKRAPLSMPPNFNLRPPEPGAPRPQEQETALEARQTIFGREQNAPSAQGDENLSAGENILLERTGAYNRDPEIRTAVDRETATLKNDMQPVVERLLGLGKNPDDAPAQVVNPQKEAERIRQNLEEGNPLDTGATPSIEQ